MDITKLTPTFASSNIKKGAQAAFLYLKQFIERDPSRWTIRTESTVVKVISGVMTVRFKSELIRNIMIKLGYANAKACFFLFASEPSSIYHHRSTNARARHVPAQAAIHRIAQTKRIILRANGQDAVIGSWNSFARKHRVLRTNKINCCIRQGHDVSPTEVQHRRCQRLCRKAHTYRRKPIFSRIVLVHAENNHLQSAILRGLDGIGTKIDPTLCRADRPVGQVLEVVMKLPKVYAEDKKQTKVSRLPKNELLLNNIDSTLMSVKEASPTCTEVGEKVALTRRIEKHWRLVGWESVQRRTVLELD
ncbi:hypothetical protein BDR06DRAFT_1017151 [Suillus hirtellus]|nr:hypothetical protein BDR06DRAFT_1017151 [Suillus hirtellus]